MSLRTAEERTLSAVTGNQKGGWRVREKLFEA